MISPIYFYLTYFSIGTCLYLTTIIYFFKKKYNNVFIFGKYGILLFLTLLFLFGFRSINVGTDTHQIFYRTPTGIDLGFIAPLYWNISGIGKYISGYQGSVFITSLVFLGAICISYYIFCKNEGIHKRYNVIPMYLLFLLSSSDMLILSVNQTRQGMAGSFLLLSSMLFFYNKKRKSIFFALLAVLSHASAIFMIPIILISKYINRNGYIITFLIFSFFVFYFHLIQFFIEYIPINYIKIKMASSVYQSALTSQFTLYTKTFLSILIGVILVIMKNLYSNKNNVYSYLLNIYMVIMSLSLMFLDFGEGANRIQRYTCFFLPFLLCYFLLFFRPIRWSFILLSTLSFCYFTLMVNYSSILITLGVK